MLFKACSLEVLLCCLGQQSPLQVAEYSCGTTSSAERRLRPFDFAQGKPAQGSFNSVNTGFATVGITG